MSALDGTVSDAGKDAIGPGIAIREDDHGNIQLRVEPFYNAPRGPGRLTLDMHQDGIVLLVEAVLNQPGIHSAGLNGYDHLGIMAQELDVIHVEGYLVSSLAHILLAVHLALAASCLLSESQRPEYCRPVLLRPDVKVLP